VPQLEVEGAVQPGRQDLVHLALDLRGPRAARAVNNVLVETVTRTVREIESSAAVV